MSIATSQRRNVGTLAVIRTIYFSYYCQSSQYTYQSLQYAQYVLQYVCTTIVLLLRVCILPSYYLCILQYGTTVCIVLVHTYAPIQVGIIRRSQYNNIGRTCYWYYYYYHYYYYCTSTTTSYAQQLVPTCSQSVLQYTTSQYYAYSNTHDREQKPNQRLVIDGPPRPIRERESRIQIRIIKIIRIS